MIRLMVSVDVDDSDLLTNQGEDQQAFMERLAAAWVADLIAREVSPAARVLFHDLTVTSVRFGAS